MKLHNINDIDAFFKMIDQCEGKVEVVSKEGDRLNLKSKLTQYVAREVFSGNITDLEIVAYNPVDSTRIMMMLMGGI